MNSTNNENFEKKSKIIFKKLMSTVGICLFTSQALYGMDPQEEERNHDLANHNYHLAFGEQTRTPKSQKKSSKRDNRPNGVPKAAENEKEFFEQKPSLTVEQYIAQQRESLAELMQEYLNYRRLSSNVYDPILQNNIDFCLEKIARFFFINENFHINVLDSFFEKPDAVDEKEKRPLNLFPADCRLSLKEDLGRKFFSKFNEKISESQSPDISDKPAIAEYHKKTADFCIQKSLECNYDEACAFSAISVVLGPHTKEAFDNAQELINIACQSKKKESIHIINAKNYKETHPNAGYLPENFKWLSNKLQIAEKYISAYHLMRPYIIPLIVKVAPATDLFFKMADDYIPTFHSSSTFFSSALKYQETGDTSYIARAAIPVLNLGVKAYSEYEKNQYSNVANIEIPTMVVQEKLDDKYLSDIDNQEAVMKKKLEEQRSIDADVAKNESTIKSESKSVREKDMIIEASDKILNDYKNAGWWTRMRTAQSTLDNAEAAKKKALAEQMASNNHIKLAASSNATLTAQRQNIDNQIKGIKNFISTIEEKRVAIEEVRSAAAARYGDAQLRLENNYVGPLTGLTATLNTGHSAYQLLQVVENKDAQLLAAAAMGVQAHSTCQKAMKDHEQYIKEFIEETSDNATNNATKISEPLSSPEQKQSEYGTEYLKNEPTSSLVQHRSSQLGLDGIDHF